ncbi:very-long-chain (3R)-3-hydroxyacyl-CoA dehydratase 4 isoform 2-T3 [Polymixia lowei]
MRLSIRLAYLFIYNLFQFCGHTWILANMTARVLTFGRGIAMTLCQLLSILELFHIADGLEKGRLLPRFIQVIERNLLLFMVIMLEEFQSKTVVCVQFFLWNILDLLRYPHELLCVIGTPSIEMLWTRYTLWIPIYILSVATEGISVYQALPYFESAGPSSFQMTLPVSANIHFPFILKVYLPILAIGASVTVWQSLKERKRQLEKWNRKLKRK